MQSKHFRNKNDISKLTDPVHEQPHQLPQEWLISQNETLSDKRTVSASVQTANKIYSVVINLIKFSNNFFLYMQKLS